MNDCEKCENCGKPKECAALNFWWCRDCGRREIAQSKNSPGKKDHIDDCMSSADEELNDAFYSGVVQKGR